MTRGRIAIGLAAVALLALLVWLAIVPRGEERAEQPASRAVGSLRPGRAAGRATTPDDPAPTDGGAVEHDRPDSVRRWRKLLTDVSRARARREGSRGARTDGGSGAAPRATLDRDYIRARIQELSQLVRECYEMALEQRPRAEGRLVVQFTIMSEPDVGAVVADSRIDPERSTPGLATDPILAECVRETMYAADFAAAAAPGQVQVSYPFEFRPGDPDAG